MSREIDRRTVLQSTGAAVGSLATGVASGVAGAHPGHGESDGSTRAGDGGRTARTADADRPLEVTVFVSDALHRLGGRERSNGYHAAEVIKAYLEGAFDQTDRFDVEVTVASVLPDPPRDPFDGPRQSLSGPCVCDESRECEWPTLLLWFREWYWDGWDDRNRRPTPDRCGEDHARATDANLLLTRGRGGGESTGNAGRVCVATVGDDLMAADADYQKFGHEDERYSAIRASLHEVGHCLMDGTGIEDRDDDGNPTGPEHDMSEVVYDADADDYAITPMGMYGDQNNERTNEHDKELTYPDDNPWSFLPFVPEAPDKPDGFAYFFSEATLDHFYRKEPYEFDAAGCGSTRERTEQRGAFRSGGDDLRTFAYDFRTDDPCEATLTLESSGDLDADLYVTLDGRTPSEDDFDRRSWSGTDRERIALGPDDLGRDAIGIAVHRYVGTGEFTLSVEEQG